MATLTDFLPGDAASWLGQQTQWRMSIRIDGPPHSGKTTLLSALVTEVSERICIAGLSEDREGMACLADTKRKMEWIMPALQVRGELDMSLTGMLNRQMVQVAVADGPSREVAGLLRDIRQSGIGVWAAGPNLESFEAEVYIRLGLDPEHRVELIETAGRPVYWVSQVLPRFEPPPE